MVLTSASPNESKSNICKDDLDVSPGFQQRAALGLLPTEAVSHDSKKKKQLKQNHIWNFNDVLRGILTDPFLQVFLGGCFEDSFQSTLADIIRISVQSASILSY